MVPQTSSSGKINNVQCLITQNSIRLLTIKVTATAISDYRNDENFIQVNNKSTNIENDIQVLITNDIVKFIEYV